MFWLNECGATLSTLFQHYYMGLKCLTISLIVCDCKYSGDRDFPLIANTRLASNTLFSYNLIRLFTMKSGHSWHY
jgi:hypothetical protein